MNGAIARIIIRYVAGALIARGLFSPADGDFINANPDIEEIMTAAVGAAIMAGTEVFYYLAKRWGWRT